MRTELFDILPALPGTTRTLTVLRFGRPGARPLAYVQAALHADEIPGMMAAVHLRQHLERLEIEGRIAGEVVLVPVANPLGLGQQVLGSKIGRFDLSDGLNFNRGFPALGADLALRLRGASPDISAVRSALMALHDELPAATPAAHLKKTLLGLALPADLVLDLHCDSEAVMHLYTHSAFARDGQDLGADLGARAVLLADVSGDDPFDEAASRPWVEAATAVAGLSPACFSCTVELRGGRDVADETGAADAEALLRFLMRRGVVAGDPGPLPEPLCRPTDLAATEPLVAKSAGIVAFRVEPGATVAAGETVVDIIDPLTGRRVPVRATQGGVLFARTASRFALAGQRLAKIAGETPLRSGKLLSP